MRELFLQAITGMNLSALWRVLARNRFQVDGCYIPRLAYLFVLAGFNSIMAIFENLINGAAIAETEITEPPIFIIGHWRSGNNALA